MALDGKTCLLALQAPARWWSLCLSEQISPSTRRIDAGTKRLAFEGAGVPHFWMVDPDEPSIVALELVEGTYREAARLVGADVFVATQPFGVRIVPAALVE